MHGYVYTWIASNYIWWYRFESQWERTNNAWWTKHYGRWCRKYNRFQNNYFPIGDVKHFVLPISSKCTDSKIHSEFHTQMIYFIVFFFSYVSTPSIHRPKIMNKIKNNNNTKVSWCEPNKLSNVIITSEAWRYPRFLLEIKSDWWTTKPLR